MRSQLIRHKSGAGVCTTVTTRGRGRCRVASSICVQDAFSVTSRGRGLREDGFLLDPLSQEAITLKGVPLLSGQVTAKITATSTGNGRVAGP